MARLRIVGRLRLDTYFSADGKLHEQLPGGGLVYAAVGARLWLDDVRVTGRAAAAFPVDRLQRLREHGIQFQLLDSEDDDPNHHLFFAYDPTHLRTGDLPASRYLHASLPIPKPLLPRAATPADQLDLGRLQPIANVTAGDVVLFSGTGWKSTLFHLQDCRRLSVHTIYDPDSEDFRRANRQRLLELMPWVDCLIVSERQAQRYFRPRPLSAAAMVTELCATGVQSVVIKRGAEGATLMDRSGVGWTIPAYPAAVTDLTGAGYAFSGGFAAGIASGLAEMEAARWGAVSASMVIEGSGPAYALSAHPLLAQARLQSLAQGRRRQP